MTTNRSTPVTTAPSPRRLAEAYSSRPAGPEPEPAALAWARLALSPGARTAATAGQLRLARRLLGA